MKWVDVMFNHDSMRYKLSHLQNLIFTQNRNTYDGCDCDCATSSGQSSSVIHLTRTLAFQITIFKVNHTVYIDEGLRYQPINALLLFIHWANQDVLSGWSKWRYSSTNTV